MHPSIHRIRTVGGSALVLATAVLLVAGCKPEPGVNFTKTQHDSLDKAKALESQMAGQADAQKQKIDDAAK